MIATGLIGTAPSKELLDIWNEREGKLVKDGPDAVTLGGVLHTRPLALLPEPKGALLGQVTKDSKDWKRIAGEAARTIPGYVAILQHIVDIACAAQSMCSLELDLAELRHVGVSSVSAVRPQHAAILGEQLTMCVIEKPGSSTRAETGQAA